MVKDFHTQVKNVFFKTHYALVSQANWCNMTFTFVNFFSLSLIWPNWDSNPDTQHIRWMTNYLSYPSPKHSKRCFVLYMLNAVYSKRYSILYKVQNAQCCTVTFLNNAPSLFENLCRNSLPHRVVQHGIFKHPWPWPWTCDLDLRSMCL